MALLVAPEALDAEGRLIDAHALAARVLERVSGEVERLFAGEPRSSAWSSAGSTLTPLPEGTVPWGALVSGREVAEPGAVEWQRTAVAEPTERTEAVAADAPDHAELLGVDEAIDAGMLDTVPQRLALLLRTDGGLAAVILSAAERALALPGTPGATAAALGIVRGDALRVVGREADAVAYERSVRVLATRTHDEEER
jgi:hypothetical protein